jgi:hypothetical protein
VVKEDCFQAYTDKADLFKDVENAWEVTLERAGSTEGGADTRDIPRRRTENVVDDPNIIRSNIHGNNCGH